MTYQGPPPEWQQPEQHDASHGWPPPEAYRYAQPPLPRPHWSTNRGLIIATCAAGIAIIIAIAATRALWVTSSATSTITYTVSGVGVASSISFADSQGTQQVTNVGLPWSRSVDGGRVASIVAQAGAGGTISCTITEGGSVVAQQTSEGQYAVVSCAH